MDATTSTPMTLIPLPTYTHTDSTTNKKTKTMDAASSSSSSSSSSRSTNVQVACRVRPTSADEDKRGMVPIISTDNEKRQITITSTGMKKSTKTFTYDRVFGRFSTQEDVYKQTVAPMVMECLAGYSNTCFAYGQTGTGKTYSMTGDLAPNAKNAGITPRAIYAIFEQLETMQADFTVRCSMLEIYQENLTDLLSSDATSTTATTNNNKGLRILEDVKKGVVVHGLEEFNCATAESTLALLQKGVTNRQTAATLCNKDSSRSHSVFTLKVVVKTTNSATGEEEVRAGQLNLVDLAGSECVGRSGAMNERAREAGNINQSLLTLGRVITALTEGHGHVPYRDSKLTRLLQESLGGRAKTWIIATLSPVSMNADETLSTLEYALKAKSIKNKPELNARSSSRTLMKEYNSEIESLKSMLMATREKNGVYMAPAEYDQMQAQLAAQAERVKESEQVLRQREEELEEATNAKVELQGQLETATESLAKTTVELEETRLEVAKVKNQLQETRTQLLATQAVVAEQVQTEASLKNQATLLTQSLDAARVDVEGLHAKVGRATEALASRSQRALVLVSECESLLESAAKGVVGMGQTGENAAGVLEAAVRGLVEKEVGEMGAALKALGGEVDLLVKDGGEAAGRVGREMCARLSKEIVDVLVEESRVQSQAMLQRAKDYRAAAEAGSKEVRVAFEETAVCMETTMQNLQDQTFAAKETLHTIVKCLSKSAAVVNGEVCTFVETFTTASATEEKRRAAFIQAQKTMIEQSSQALLQAVQQQVTQMVATCEHASNAYNTEASQATEQQRTAVLSFTDMVDGFVDGTAEDMKATEAELTKNTLAPMVMNIKAALTSLADTHKPAHAAALTKVDDEAARLVVTLEEATATADQKMQATLETGAEVIKSIEAETQKVETLLQSKGVGVSSAMAAAGEAASTRLNAQAEAFGEMVQSSLRVPLAAAVATVTESVSQSEGVVKAYGTTAGQVEGRTNTTPQKREYRAPAGPLSATRPHEEIMAEARRAGGGGGGGGVDVMVVEEEGEEKVVAPAVAADGFVVDGEGVGEMEEQVQEQEEHVPVASSSSSSSAEKRAHPAMTMAEEEETGAENVSSPSKKLRLSVEKERGKEDQENKKVVEEEEMAASAAPAAASVAAAAPPTKAATTSIPRPKTSSRIPRAAAKPLGDRKNV